MQSHSPYPVGTRLHSPPVAAGRDTCWRSIIAFGAGVGTNEGIEVGALVSPSSVVAVSAISRGEARREVFSGRVGIHKSFSARHLAHTHREYARIFLI